MDSLLRVASFHTGGSATVQTLLYLGSHITGIWFAQHGSMWVFLAGESHAWNERKRTNRTRVRHVMYVGVVCRQRAPTLIPRRQRRVRPGKR